jgi:potassium-dependent mechanosensitive channel
VSAPAQVLQAPEAPDVELRAFGDNGVNFAVEFWVDGIDDGKNKFTSEIRFLIWEALKKAGIAMPFPQREVRLLGDVPTRKRGTKS